MNAADVLVEEPDAAQEAAAMCRDAALAMARRLRLLRAAWSGDCGPLNIQQLASLVQGLPNNVQAGLSALAPGPFSGPTARVLLNLLILGADALPKGGRVSLGGDGVRGFTLSIDGAVAAWPVDCLPATVGADAEGFRGLQLSLVMSLARLAGLRFRVESKSRLALLAT